MQSLGMFMGSDDGSSKLKLNLSCFDMDLCVNRICCFCKLPVHAKFCAIGGTKLPKDLSNLLLDPRPEFHNQTYKCCVWGFAIALDCVQPRPRDGGQPDCSVCGRRSWVHRANRRPGCHPSTRSVEQ